MGLWISRVRPPRESSLFGHIMNALLAKFVRSRSWLYLSWPYLFCILMTLTNKNVKRNLANIQPSPILISRLVINAYLFYFPASRGLSRCERLLLAGNFSTYQLLQVLSHSSQMSYRDTANNYKVVHIASSVSTCLNYTDVHSILSF